MRVLAMLLVAGLSGCSGRDDAARAARGEVDPEAPVRTSAEFVVAASPAAGWSVLTDVAE